jgi:F420-dependent oxidoreductase-like protein
MSLQFGIALPQVWVLEQEQKKNPVEVYETMTSVAQSADELGFASAWLADHLHPSPRGPQEVPFECWTTTAAVARDTKRIRIGQTVTCNGFRNPALLAKMASTVDVLSHGRLTCGIGAGWHEQEYRAFGYDFPDTPDRLRLLGEAVQVLLAMWTQDEPLFEGKYYQVRGAINQPKGVQKPHIPLLIGGGGEKITLKLVAQYGDACNLFGDVETIKHKLAVLKAHCEAVGRDYERIHRTVGCLCSIGETDEQAKAKVPAGILDRPVGAGALIGSPETIRKRLDELEAIGVQEVILGFPDILEQDTLRFFAEEFMAKIENKVSM